MLSLAARNVVKNAKNPVLLFALGSFASKSHLSQRLPIYLNDYVLGVVSVRKSALSAQFTSSTCPQIWRRKSPIDTRPTASSFIGCPCHDLDKYSDLWEPTVLARVQRSRSSVASWSQIWDDTTVHQIGKKSWSISAAANFRVCRAEELNRSTKD